MEDAKRLLVAEISRGAASVRVFTLLGIVYGEHQEQHDEKAEVMRQAVRAHPKAGRLFNNLAYYLAMANQLDEAASVLRRVPHGLARTVR
jgi:Tfp pilus assembly protein PilF